MLALRRWFREFTEFFFQKGNALNLAIAVVVGVIVAAVVYMFNLQKYAIIVATAAAGAGVIIYTFLAVFYGVAAVELFENPVKLAIDN